MVARSSAKAKFRALAQGICEGIWLVRVLKELQVKSDEPMKMFCDNMAAISIAKNLVHHDRTKHVELDPTRHQIYKLHMYSQRFYLELHLKILFPSQE